MLKPHTIAMAGAFAVALMAGYAAEADAAVIVENSSTLNQSSGTITLNAASNSVLLVAVSAQDPSASPEVTLDPGGSATVYTTLAVSQTQVGKNVIAAIFAIDLGTVSAGTLDFEVNALGGNQVVSAFQLSNAALPAADTATATTANLTTGLDASFTGLAAGSMIFAVAHAAQGQNGLPTVTGTPTPTFTASLDRSSFLSSSMGMGYTTGVSGDASLSISGTDTTDGAALAAVAIAPIPEPASLALLGLGSLLIVGGRRKRA